MIKRYRKVFIMCQSMFCAIPFPSKTWDEQARVMMPLFLPVVGLEIGLIWAALAWLISALALPRLIAGLILSAFPFLITGFLHLDGFMDVIDTVRSCRSLERRREILKDPHVGAFGVIGIVLLIPVISRCCSALAVVLLRPMSCSQYAQQKISRAAVAALFAMIAAVLTAGFLICGKYGFSMIGCIVGYCMALRRGVCSLGGMNGDIAGYALTLGELSAAAVYALI